jgi:FKBP-type peptidyl-prolyl cis-trans isomerase
VGAGIGAGVYYYKDQPNAAPNSNLVQVGDNVTVTYIGILGSGAEQGRVFDTSVYDVATNNATYPKALQFGYRGSAAAYTQLDVYVGQLPVANYTINNLTFIQVVPGFWQGLVGIPTNVTHTIVVPPNLGYAAYSCNVVKPLTFQLPVTQTLAGTDFQKLYPGVEATTGTSFTDPTYGWTVDILSANSTSITLQNLAKVGSTSSPNGWPVEVTNVTSTANGSGAITLVNELSPSSAGHLGGSTTASVSCGGSSASKYIVTAVNESAGTYTEDFNEEVSGQTLIFLVKVIDLFPAGFAPNTAA